MWKRPFSLFLCLSLVLPPVHPSSAAAVESDLAALVRRAKHSDRPGARGGMPTLAEVNEAESKLLQWRDGINGIEDAINDNPSLLTERVNDYFNALTSLVLVRLVLGLPHGPEWRNQFALHVPAAAIHQSSGLIGFTQNGMGDGYFPLSIDKGASNAYTIGLTASFVQGLELGLAVNHPNDASFLALLRFVGVHELLNNLRAIQTLRSGASGVNSPLGLPKDLREQIRQSVRGFKELDQILDEQQRVGAENRMRLALVQSYLQIKADLPEIPKAQVIRSLNVLTQANPALKKLTQEFKVLKSEFDEKVVQAAFEGEIKASNVFFNRLDIDQEGSRALRAVVAGANSNLILSQFIQVIDRGAMILRPDERLQLVNALVPAVERYADSVPDSVLHAWFAYAKKLAAHTLYEEPRAQLLAELKSRSAQAEWLSPHLAIDTLLGDPVDFSVLQVLMKKDILPSDAGSTYKDWITKIVSHSDYLSARDEYSALVSRLLDPSILSSGLNAGIVRSDLAKQMIEKKNFRPRLKSPEPGLSKNETTPVLTEVLLKRAESRRKADYLRLIEAGERLGFHKVTPRGVPSVADLLEKNRLRKQYFALQFDLKIISDYPILATKINGVPLYDLLVQASDALEADRSLDRALGEVEQQNIKMIKQVLGATSVQEMETLAVSPITLELMARAFPEFNVHETDMLVRMGEVSPVTHLIEHYVSPFVMWGFTVPLALHGVAWMSKLVLKKKLPLIESVVSSALMQGVLFAASVLCVPVAYHDYSILQQSRRTKDDAVALFGSGVSGRPFVTYSEKQALEAGYAWSRGLFIGRMALDVGFLYVPMGFQLYRWINKSGRVLQLTERDVVEDILAFRTLKLNPGDWKGLSEAQSTIEGPEMERAFRRLSDRVRSGVQWKGDIS